MAASIPNPLMMLTFFSAIISDMGFFHIGSTVELLAFLYVLYSGYQTYQELCDHPDEPPQDNSNR